MCHKKNQDYKNCLRASQIKNRINYSENLEIDVDCLKEDKKEFIKKANVKNTKKI